LERKTFVSGKCLRKKKKKRTCFRCVGKEQEAGSDRKENKKGVNKENCPTERVNVSEGLILLSSWRGIDVKKRGGVKRISKLRIHQEPSTPFCR